MRRKIGGRNFYPAEGKGKTYLPQFFKREGPTNAGGFVMKEEGREKGRGGNSTLSRH